MPSEPSALRLSVWKVCLLVCCMIAACDGSEARKEADPAPPAKTSPGPEATPAASCDATHAKTLENELLRMCEAEALLTAVEVPQAPWEAPSTALPHTSRIEMVAGRVRVAGLVCETPKKVLEALALERELAGKLGKVAEPWTLEIAAATPTSEVAALFKALADAGHAKGRVVVTVPATGMPKPRRAQQLAKLHRRVANENADDRGVILAREMDKALPKCPALEETVQALGNVDPAMKCKLLARGVPEALVSCHCPKEDELLTFLYAAIVDTEIPERSAALLDVTLDPSAAPRSGSTWGEVVKALDETSLAELWLGG